jgi:Tol biopolymer transport system component
MKTLKEIQCRPIRIPQFGLLLIAGVYFGFVFLACSSGNGGGVGRTADLPPVVFLANKENVDIVELFASFNGGEDIEKLSGAMAANGNVVDFEISPDGLQVAYVADQRIDGIFELFVSPVDGSAPPANPVSGAMAIAGNGIATEPNNPDRYSFAWSSDSERIAYRAAQDLADAIELYAVRPDGTDNVKLHPDFAAGQEVGTFAWAPDGSRAAYLANQSFAAAAVELFTSPPTGSAGNIRVSDDLVDGGNVEGFSWAPNSSRIAYRADQDTDEQFELFVTRSNRRIIDKVSLPLLASGDVSSDYGWAPNSSRLAYRAVFLENILYTSDKPGLFTATAEGTSSFRVSGGIRPANALGVIAFQWAPNSARLSYVADQNIEGQFDLFATPPNSATPVFVKLTEFSVIGGDVTASDWSPNSRQVAFITDQRDVEFPDLFSAFQTGLGFPRPVSNLQDLLSEVQRFTWSPDSTLIAFQADQDTVGEFELYTAPPDGIINTKISNVSATGGQVRQFLWAPNGEGIGFIADQDTLAQYELYLSLPDGREVDKVSGRLVDGGSVLRFDWVP